MGEEARAALAQEPEHDGEGKFPNENCKCGRGCESEGSCDDEG